MATKQRGPRTAAELERLGVPFVPDAPSVAAISQDAASERPAGRTQHVKDDLATQHHIDGRIDVVRDDEPRLVKTDKGIVEYSGPMVLHDEGGKRSVPGLSLRIGKRSATWYYSIDKIEKGHRTVKLKTLGQYDRGTRDENPIRATWHMGVDAARDAATVKSAGYIQRTIPGDTGEKFEKIFEAYIVRLKTKADDNGKADRWRRNVAALGKKYLLPRWGGYTLAEMSEAREAIGDWYNTIAADAPSTAKHLRSIIAAIYNWRRKRGASLPSDNPGMAVIDKKPAYKTRQGRAALPRVPLDQFPAWAAEWRKVESPMVRAYWLFLLFTGARPGEAARTLWTDPDLTAGTLTIGNTKNTLDICIPLSPAIRRVLDLAKAASTEDTDLIFHGPNVEHWSHRSPPLDVPGHGLRRTYKTVAGKLGMADEMSGRLLGHQPQGVSADYADPLAIQRAEFLSDLQAKVSDSIITLLGSDPTVETFAPLPPSPRDVARAAGLLHYVGGCDKHGPTAKRSVATGRCCLCVAEKNERQAPRRLVSRRRGNPVHAA